MENESSSAVRSSPRASCWYVYVLVSAATAATYVGVTTDAPRRLAQHNGVLPGGAKSTRAGRPWSLGAVFGPFADRGDAQRWEHRVKKRRGRARLRAPETIGHS